MAADLQAHRERVTAPQELDRRVRAVSLSRTRDRLLRPASLSCCLKLPDPVMHCASLSSCPV